VDFFDGFTLANFKFFNYRVRAVRGGS